jgi:hypothetical protein
MFEILEDMDTQNWGRTDVGALACEPEFVETWRDQQGERSATAPED